MRSWVIGNSADCDVVVDSPLASSRHCQLSRTDDGYVVDDLGSTNGTYVNAVRITSSMRVTPADEITLGRTVPMPWPVDVVRYIRIGRVPGNDIVLDDPRVSSRHARLIVVTGSENLIEDLGSSNGTFINSMDRRVTGTVPLLETDIVYFGSFTVPAARLLPRTIEAEPVAPPAPPPPPPPEPFISIPPPKPTWEWPAAVPHRSPSSRSRRRARRAREEAAQESGPPLTRTFSFTLWVVVLLAKALVLAVLVGWIFGRDAAVPITAANWPAVGQAIASTTFALALLAIWLGCSMATLESAAGRSPSLFEGVDSIEHFFSWIARLLVLVTLCAVGCALVLAIVYWGSGFRGAWLAMWGVMALASMVGLLIGLLVTAFGRTWITTPLVLLVCFGPMIALGGRLWPLTDLSPPVRMVAAAMPSRWAFEDLLLLEAGANPPVPATGGPPVPTIDIAEPYFPAATERMGTRADAMSLGFMVIGLAAMATFISWSSKPRP